MIDSESRDSLVILFTRFPEPGRTKTRLIPVLGPDGAANLQRRMTEHALRRLADLEQDSAVRIEVRHDGGTRRGGIG